MRVRVRGINTVRRFRKDGSFALYRYHRKTGTLLKGEPGTPEFIESVGTAERTLRERARGTVAALIRKFEASPAWQDLGDSTKLEYRRKFRAIERRWGSAPIASFEDTEFRRDVIAWRDEIAKRARREADNLVSALNRIGSFAFDQAEVKANVLDGIKRVYHSDRADKLWLPEHVGAFTRHASPELCAALMLAMHTGQRQGDLRRLPWSAYDGQRITLRQSKGKKLVSIRCTTALRKMLDGMERRGLLILTTATGRVWTKRYLNQKWTEAERAAGLVDEDLHFHDLRGTAVTMLAEAGCTIPEIAAITGHSLKTVTHILETYLSRTRALADAAILKLDRRLKRLQKGS